MFEIFQLFSIWAVSTAIAEVGTRQNHYFSRQPFNDTVRLGGTVYLRCAVQNMQTGVYWSIDGFGLGSTFVDPRLSFQGNKAVGDYNLRITDAQLQDDGKYRCLVYSDTDNGLLPLMSRPAYLDVIVPPKDIVLQPVSSGVINVKLSQSVTITCTAPDTKPASEIHWRVGDREYRAISRKVFPGSKDKLTSVSSSITLKPYKSDNGSVVECIVRHPALDEPAVRSAALKVLYPPHPPTISVFQSQPMQSGQNISVACDAAGGNPRASITWLIGDEIIQQDYERTGTGSGSLLHHQLRRQDNGKMLICRVETPALDEALDDQVKLSVYYPPQSIIIKREPEEGTQQNGVMKFTCHYVESNPKASLTWLIDDVVLPLQWSVKVGSIPYMIHNFEDGNFASHTSLTLTTVRRQDAYLNITCRARIAEINYAEEVQTRPKVNYPPRTVNLFLSSLIPPLTPLNKEETCTTSNSKNSKLVYKVGDVIMLKCQAKGGSPPPNLNWFLDGIPTANDDSAVVSAPQIKTQNVRDTLDSVDGEAITVTTLELTLEPSHNGVSVSCVANHPGYKNSLSKEKLLKVAFPPTRLVIEEFPSSLVAGKPISLTCKTTSSYPVAKISWYRNGVKLPPRLWADLPCIEGSLGGFVASSRLIFTPSSEDDGVAYTCKAEVNILQKNVTESHKVDIEYPPAFYPISGNNNMYNATDGDSFIDIKVLTRANPSQVTYSWFRIFPTKTDVDASETSSKILLIKNTRFVWTEDKGTLRINHPREEDEGTYRVRASNSRGSTELSITLNVFYPPKITAVSGAEGTLMEGDSSRLRCNFKSHPLLPLRVDWNKKVPGSGRSKYDTETFADYSTLTLENLTAADRGGYQCTVDNGIGGKATKELTLQVMYAPIFDSVTPSKVAVSSVGDDGHLPPTAMLHCQVYSFPTPTVVWAEDNHTIANDDERYLVQQKVIDVETSQSTLTVNISTPNVPTQNGALPVFSCIASNTLGKRIKRIRLVLEGPPDAPSTLNAYNVTDSAVYLAWKRGFDGGAQQHFIVQYKRIVAGNGNVEFREVTTKSNGGRVTGLEQNQEYLFRVIAKNENGQSAPSETIRVKTMNSLRQSVSGSKLITYLLPVVCAVVFAFVIGVVVIAFRRCRISKQSYRPKTIETDCESLALFSRRSTGSSHECKSLVSEKKGGNQAEALITSDRKTLDMHGETDAVSIKVEQSHHSDGSVSGCSSHRSDDALNDAECGYDADCTVPSFCDTHLMKPFDFKCLNSSSAVIQRSATEKWIPRKYSEPRFRFDVFPTGERRVNCFDESREWLDEPPFPVALEPQNHFNYEKRLSSSFNARSRFSSFGNTNTQYQGNPVENFRQYHTLDSEHFSHGPCQDGLVNTISEREPFSLDQDASFRKYHRSATADSTETCLYNFVSRPSDGYATSLLKESDFVDAKYVSTGASEVLESHGCSLVESNHLCSKKMDNVSAGAPKRRIRIAMEDQDDTLGVDFSSSSLDVIGESRRTPASPRFRDKLSKALSKPKPLEFPATSKSKNDSSDRDDDDSGCGDSAVVHVHCNTSHRPSSIGDEGMVLRI